ncbi:hypothetical protein AMECASPLE_007335 [Ameca splendens]|uniref:Uncharacterized protein n=1 Tax=Ameca splendens TaxID=208324 RepID=A0ABV0ZA46_9TELE
MADHFTFTFIRNVSSPAADSSCEGTAGISNKDWLCSTCNKLLHLAKVEDKEKDCKTESFQRKHSDLCNISQTIVEEHVMERKTSGHIVSIQCHKSRVRFT